MGGVFFNKAFAKEELPGREKGVQISDPNKKSGGFM